MPSSLSALTDRELYRALTSGGQQGEFAFTELYDRYSNRVFAYCLKVLADRQAAQDVFQETFVSFYRKATEGAKIENVFGYLLMIARNTCINYKRVQVRTVDLDHASALSSPSYPHESKELLGLVRTAIELLESEYREAFVLREYDGLDYEEIAKLLGLTVSNAKVRVSRARAKIRTILAPYLKELEMQ